MPTCPNCEDVEMEPIEKWVTDCNTKKRRIDVVGYKCEYCGYEYEC